MPAVQTFAVIPLLKPHTESHTHTHTDTHRRMHTQTDTHTHIETHTVRENYTTKTKGQRQITKKKIQK